MDGPAFRYYRSLLGAWQGRLAFELTDLRALRAESLNVALPVAGTALLTRGLGPVQMSTTLEAAADGTFAHTTTVKMAGVTLFDSRETITVSDDGRTLRMDGSQRGRFQRPLVYTARGEVDEGATRATYAIPWFGVKLTQRTAIIAEGLAMEQETRWSRAKVLLTRQAVFAGTTATDVNDG